MRPINGKLGAPRGLLPPWGYALEHDPHPMLVAALRCLHRNGAKPRALAECKGDSCDWVRQTAECLARGECCGAVVFCEDANLACCVANKVPGIRAAAVASVFQAQRAVSSLGANLLAVEQGGRTFFEFKEILRLCCLRSSISCPEKVAGTLRELDGHAHR